jgi:hypothetical protein
MGASSADKGRELHLQVMTYEIDSHALSTAESGSTGREGCDMTIMSEQPRSCTCHGRIFRGNGYLCVLYTAARQETESL